MNYDIKCDINNLIEVRDKMLATTEELVKKLDYMVQEIEDSKRIYDSPTATYIREQCDNIITFGKKYIDNTVIPSIHNLDYPIREYSEFLSETSKSVGGDNV